MKDFIKNNFFIIYIAFIFLHFLFDFVTSNAEKYLIKYFYSLFAIIKFFDFIIIYRFRKS